MPRPLATDIDPRRRLSTYLSILVASGLLWGCGTDGPVEAPPALAFESEPKIDRVSQGSITVSAVSTRDATIYATVQSAGAPVPGAAQIREGRDGAGQPSLGTAVAVSRASSPVSVRLEGLERYRDHLVALLLEDGGEEFVVTLSVSNPLTSALESAAEAPHLRSLLVSVGGELVVESYFNGSGRDTLQDVRSVTKGITSLLVGQAMEQGYLGLNTTIGETFPAKYLDGLESAKLGITVEQLLTMSSGLGWIESEFGGWTQLPDEIEGTLSRDLTSVPGAVFEYSTPDLQMLSVIFQESTGQTLHEFARDNLFAQLGITESRWVLFETGYALAGGFSFIRSRDLVKIGEMVLAGGTYEGSSVVPADYLAEMTSAKFSFPGYLTTGDNLTSRWFGYLWWESDIDGVDGFMTSGYGGQNVMVFPSLDLVIVTTSVATVPPGQANAQQIATWDAVAHVFRALDLG